MRPANAPDGKQTSLREKMDSMVPNRKGVKSLWSTSDNDVACTASAGIEVHEDTEISTSVSSTVLFFIRADQSTVRLSVLTEGDNAVTEILSELSIYRRQKCDMLVCLLKRFQCDLLLLILCISIQFLTVHRWRWIFGQRIVDGEESNTLCRYSFTLQSNIIWQYSDRILGSLMVDIGRFVRTHSETLTTLRWLAVICIAFHLRVDPGRRGFRKYSQNVHWQFSIPSTLSPLCS